MSEVRKVTQTAKLRNETKIIGAHEVHSGAPVVKTLDMRNPNETVKKTDKGTITVRSYERRKPAAKKSK